MDIASRVHSIRDTSRVSDLRRRVRNAMERPPVTWDCPERIADEHMSDPLPLRKARAIALKLRHMPTDLWEGQLLAGSMTLEEPRVHAEWGFPDYLTDEERARAEERGLSMHSVFGHVVPDYPRLLRLGLSGIKARAADARADASSADEVHFLDSVVVALDGVSAYAARLAEHCATQSERTDDDQRAAELRSMAADLRQVPDGPAQSFRQALQSVWLLHMVFHSTMNANAMGRLDQYVWPFLETDLKAGRLDLAGAMELVSCFCLKFNERAKTTEDQLAESRTPEQPDPDRRTRHYTSSQIGTRRDGLDATNHWLQNIVVGGLRPDGADGTNPLSYLLLEAFRRNEMTNPLLTVRLHEDSPEELVRFAGEVLRDGGGGMPALFNDEALVPALEGVGIPHEHALDYTNDGCWEVIIPGRTDFRFLRLSLMLCLEWALNHGRTRLTGLQDGLDTGEATEFTEFAQVWDAFLRQLDHMVERVVRRVVANADDRHSVAPVPLLSALLDGPIEKRRDMTAGGARFRTYGMLAESAAHAIDSLAAIRTVVFEDGAASMAELCAALEADFEGYESLRARLLAAPKYGNDAKRADALGRRVMEQFARIVGEHARPHRDVLIFPCGVATFSWYIGIGQGLGASPDGRRARAPVSSNFSPALGRDREGIPAAILSYAHMPHEQLPAGGPLDLRLPRRLVEGEDGTRRMAALLRSFVETGGSMMTLTVVDTEELRAAQREPEQHRALRVRMGGWCAYFTMLSREQQDHHIRRQEAGA
ncbi:MAG: pyruvate formate lyase family protein [Candidatus Brocadiia bacterium]